MLWISLITTLLIAPKAVAYTGAVSAATGGSGRASIEASDSPFLNPAGVAHLTGYYFTMGYVSGGNSQALGSDFALSITDNLRETVIPTSMAFSQKTEGLQNRDVQKDFRISVGNFLNQQLAMGLALVHRQDFLSSGSYSQTDLDMGFLWAPTKDFGLAFVTGHLFGGAGQVPADHRLQPYRALAASFNYQQFMRLKADIVTEPNGPSSGSVFGLGLENYVNRWFVMRMGYQFDSPQNAKLYTGGLGFIGPVFGLHYAYQMSPDSQSLERHSIDLAVPVW